MHLNFWEGSRTVFIAFKGTDGLVDTMIDLMAVNNDAHGVDSKVTVHTGMLCHFLSVTCSHEARNAILNPCHCLFVLIEPA